MRCKPFWLLMVWLAAAPAAAAPLPADWQDEIESGDLVFIGGTDIWTEMAAAFSKTDKRFGHVGIIIREGNDLAVIEAGGFVLREDAAVGTRPLDEFIRGAQHVAVYRPALINADLRAMLDYAVKAAADRLPFDREWRLDTPDTVYCTEFVWRALSAGAGTDPVPDRTMAGDLEIIALDDLLAAPGLTLVIETGPTD